MCIRDSPYEGADIAEQLSEAVSNIHGELTAYEVEDVYKRQAVRCFARTFMTARIPVMSVWMCWVK